MEKSRVQNRSESEKSFQKWGFIVLITNITFLIAAMTHDPGLTMITVHTKRFPTVYTLLR